MTYILGISGYYHDSAACLLRDGHIRSAAQEERFTRRKHDPRFPSNAIRYCLKDEAISLRDVEYIVFYDKPLLKFDRLLETYLSSAPRGIRSFLTAVPVWLKEKLFLKDLLRRELSGLSDIARKSLPEILFTEHHESHAASAFYPSPYENAAVLCLDGVGEWATTSAWQGQGSALIPLWEIPFPHSLGLLYSAFTYHSGFKVNSGEYKLMGLAPYGEPRYVQAIYDHVINVKPDGTFRLNMEVFNYCAGLTMTSERFSNLFGGPPRKPESPVTQREKDLARSIQAVIEEVLLRLARTLHEETGNTKLCMAGGVALNCVANGRLRSEGPFDGIWVQPAAGDAGGAIGAAMAAFHGHLGKPRDANPSRDAMSGSFLGPSFSGDAIERSLNERKIPYSRWSDADLFPRVASELAQGKVVGWFQGRMEFGPRALGARSILGDARDPRMQSTMNMKIKFRESFRPFAPSVLRNRVSDYFESDSDNPYMLFTAPVRKGAGIPAVTHVDNSARIQTVDESDNPRYYRLLKAFELATGCGVLINTSFNVRGEPIVCTPQDAYRCFMRTDMDVLVLEDCLVYKGDQQPEEADVDWRREFVLD